MNLKQLVNNQSQIIKIEECEQKISKKNGQKIHMDKQSLRSSTDANSLRNSYRSISRSGFIQTLAGQNDMDMKKSRIYNLPSYKKIDLSSKLDMVVVFQAIQLTRLSQQIQTLRVALMDYQRQVNNYRNYQIQIRQLNQKVCQYQSQRISYQQQIQKLNLICQQLYADLQKQKQLNNENSESARVIAEELKREKQKGLQMQGTVEKWKNRLSALQKSKEAQLQELKLAMENQRKSVLNKEINQLQTKYNTQIKGLEKEIYNLRQSLTSQKQSHKHLQIQLSKKQIQIQNLTLIKGQIKQYQNRFSQIQNQFLKLNDLLRKKQQQQQKHRQQQKKLNAKLKQYQKKFQKQYKQKIKQYQQLQKNHKQLKQKAIRLQLQNQHLQQSQSKALKLQNLLNQAGDQIDRLNSIIKDKIKYIQGWNEKYNLLQVKFGELERARETQSSKLENKLINKEKQLTRVGLSAKNRLEEIQSLKDKNSKLQKQLNTLSTQLKTQNQQLQQKNDNLTLSLKQLQTTLLQLKQQHTQLKLKQQQLHKYKHQLQPQYKKQLHSLTLTIKQKDQQLNILQIKLQHTKKSTQLNSQAYKQQIQTLKNKNNQLTKFADQLNNNINQKIKQIKMFKQAITKIDQRVAECQVVEKKLSAIIGEKQKILKDMAQLQQENNLLFDKCLATQNKIFTLQKQLFQKTQENSTILHQLKYLQQQKLIIVNEMQQVNQQLKASFERQRQALSKHKELQKTIDQFEQKTKSINDKLSKKEKENQLNQQEFSNQMGRVKQEAIKYKQKVQQLEQQLHTAKMQIKKQISLRQSQTRQHQSLIQQLKSQSQKLSLQSTRHMSLLQSQLKTQLQHHKSSHLKQKQLSQSLQLKLKQSSQSLTKLQQKNKKLQEKTQEQQKQIKRLQEQLLAIERQLKSKKKQIEECNRVIQEKEEKEVKEKRTVKNAIESKDQQYEKLKKLYEKEKHKASQQISLLQLDKQKLTRQLSKHHQQTTKLHQQLKKSLSQGRNSKHFLQQFTSLKHQSQSIHQHLHQLTTRYFLPSTPNSPSHQLYIQTQLKTIKQIIQQNLKLYQETIAQYQKKVNELIEKNEVRLQEVSEVTEKNAKLKEEFILLESKFKILQYENQQNLLQQQKDSQRLSRDLKIISTPSILSPTPKKQKNISTLFQSMIDSSSSIIQPLCSKDNQPQLQANKKLTSSGFRSMKNLITPFGGNVSSPKANKVTGDMIESTVFEISGNGKSSQYFNRFSK